MSEERSAAQHALGIPDIVATICEFSGNPIAPMELAAGVRIGRAVKEKLFPRKEFWELCARVRGLEFGRALHWITRTCTRTAAWVPGVSAVQHGVLFARHQPVHFLKELGILSYVIAMVPSTKSLSAFMMREGLTDGVKGRGGDLASEWDAKGVLGYIAEKSVLTVDVLYHSLYMSDLKFRYVPKLRRHTPTYHRAQLTRLLVGARVSKGVKNAASECMEMFPGLLRELEASAFEEKRYRFIANVLSGNITVESSEVLQAWEDVKVGMASELVRDGFVEAAREVYIASLYDEEVFDAHPELLVDIAVECETPWLLWRLAVHGVVSVPAALRAYACVHRNPRMMDALLSGCELRVITRGDRGEDNVRVVRELAQAVVSEREGDSWSVEYSNERAALRVFLALFSVREFLNMLEACDEGFKERVMTALAVEKRDARYAKAVKVAHGAEGCIERMLRACRTRGECNWVTIDARLQMRCPISVPQ